MDSIRRNRALAASTLAVAVLGATAATANAHEMTVQIPFSAVAGGTPVQCGTPVTNLGTGNTTAQVQDLRFYVSNVRLIRKNGSSVALKLAKNDSFNFTQGGNRVSLIDLENGAGACATDGDSHTNSSIKGTVPHGEYVGIKFYVGVPFPLNHTDVVTAKPPLDIAAMNWSWQSGRKFTKIEVTDPAPGTWRAKTFFVHLGSTGCVGNPATGATVNCKASNRASVTLTRFNPETQRVALDLRKLFAGSDITVNQAGAGGCMSGPTDPECGPIFEALGIDWQPNGSGTGESMHGGMHQTVFRAVRR